MFLLRIRNISYMVLLANLVLIPSSYADITYKVKATDTLSKIVNSNYQDNQLSHYQVYIGLLAENPDAFLLGNINYLKKGYLLNLPDSTSLLAMERADAANLIAEHNDNAKQHKKVEITPPFEGYSAKSNSIRNVSRKKNEISVLSEKKQKTNEELEKLDSESEALRIRMAQLMADKEAMDAELLQLNSLIKQ